MRSQPLTPAENAAIDLPTVDRSRRHPNDQLLRRHGFAIFSRPKYGPTLWQRGGETFTEFEALHAVSRELQSVVTTSRPLPEQRARRPVAEEG